MADNRAMDQLIAYLTTPTGQELTHAVAIILIAIAAVLSNVARIHAEQASKAMTDHLAEHRLEQVRPGPEDRPPT